MRKELGSESGDYIFRYYLKSGEEKEPFHSDRLLEMLRAQIENILDLVILTEDGRELKPDGFKLLRDRRAVHQIFPRGQKEEDAGHLSTSPPVSPPPSTISTQDVKNASLYEPRIEFIQKQLHSLLSVVELERQGQKVEADGFRLKHLQDWLVPSSGDPVEVWGYAAARCDCHCVFCYHQGNPSSLALTTAPKSAQEEWQEIKTRLKYFSPQARQALSPALGCLWEVFAHPRSVELMRLLREKTSQPFRITTNGTKLTPEFITQLTSLKPLYLYLSLNSSSPSRRKRLMRDRNPETAINSLPWLREAGIPFAVVIVPWIIDSLSEMLEDLSATVAYATQHDAHLIEINLPGYTKYFSVKELFDREEVWSAVVSTVRKLREKTSCPIVVMSSMYEENLCEPDKNLPRIIGIVQNSPAFLAGLMRGDIILAIDGLSVRHRPQVRDLLHLLQRSESKQARVTVSRDNQTVDLVLDLERFSYPYSREGDIHLGIIFLGTGLRISYLERLKEIIDQHRARNVLFLTSTLVKPTLEQYLAESPLFADTSLHLDLAVSHNRFFGGNIFMGDLLIVQDFIDSIKDYVKATQRKPDLVVLPSSPFNLGGWGRDLTGRVYLDIERETGIPVELLECSTIYD